MNGRADQAGRSGVRPAVASLLALLVLGVLPGALRGQDTATVLTAAAFFVGPLLVTGPMTLLGFCRDLRIPVPSGGGTVLAYRPRHLAVAVSWIALYTGTLCTVLVPPAWGTLGAHPASVLLLSGTAIGVLLAAALPRASRQWSLRGGYVELGSDGLHVHAPDGDSEILRSAVPEEARSHPLRFDGVRGLTTDEDHFLVTHHGPMGTDPRVAFSLPDPSARRLDHRVRWVPGALEAVTRWTRDGFAPVPSEVRALNLPSHIAPVATSARPRTSRHEKALVIVLAVLTLSVWGSMIIMNPIGRLAD